MDTTEQELEALKSWWQENGRTLIAGVVIGLSGVAGWTWWQGHLRSQAEVASQGYQRLLEEAAQDNHESVRARASTLIEDYPQSGYAALGALLAAKSAVIENDLQAAKQRLNWVIEQSDNPSFRDVARIRLARVLAEENDFDTALEALDAVEQPAFGASAGEIRGDILVTTGDASGAREAYLGALASETVTGATRSRLQMKIDDLGSGSAGNVSG